jgi:ketosteroid isomerase-like protein
VRTDSDQIRRLADDYCWYADARDVDGMVSLFTKNGVMDAQAVGMNIIQGHEALREFYKLILPMHEYSQHLSGTHRIDIEGDSAKGTSYYLMQGAIMGAGPISAAGYFEDQYVRTADGWRFSSRRGVPLIPPNLKAMTDWVSGGS